MLKSTTQYKNLHKTITFCHTTYTFFLKFITQFLKIFSENFFVVDFLHNSQKINFFPHVMYCAFFLVTL